LREWERMEVGGGVIGLPKGKKLPILEQQLRMRTEKPENMSQGGKKAWGRKEKDHHLNGRNLGAEPKPKKTGQQIIPQYQNRGGGKGGEGLVRGRKNNYLDHREGAVF